MRGNSGTPQPCYQPAGTVKSGTVGLANKPLQPTGFAGG
jgi:hypothetical protein